MAARLLLAYFLPMTGDEAYFVLWGRYPDLGYYDHPPMTGWWMSALLFISDAPAWLRLPAILLPTLLALSAQRLLQPILGQSRAVLGALLILLVPANTWNVLFTTDTPLVFMGVLSALFFIRAHHSEKLGFYLVAGLFFAGAVLSKYFAALLGITYAVATLLSPSRQRIAGLFLIGLLMLPALALMGWWNAGHCWPNILFNLINRNTHAGFQWQHPVVYLLMLFYMLGFLPLIHGVQKPRWLIPWHGDVDDRLFWTLAWTPLILLGLVSLGKQVGLHWVLTFIPLTLLALLRQFPEAQCLRIIKWLKKFAALHFLVLAVLLGLPLSFWENNPRYTEIVWTTRAPELVKAAGISEERAWFTDGYTYSAELSYARDRTLGRTQTYGGSHIGVFGFGSHYARQDDQLTDFRALDGKNLGILLRSAPDLKDYTPYFQHITLDTLEISGARFYRILGDGFQYATYRTDILTQARDRFYRIPDWLPNCGCFFLERYFSETD